MFGLFKKKDVGPPTGPHIDFCIMPGVFEPDYAPLTSINLIQLRDDGERQVDIYRMEFGERAYDLHFMPSDGQATGERINHIRYLGAMMRMNELDDFHELDERNHFRQIDQCIELLERLRIAGRL